MLEPMMLRHRRTDTVVSYWWGRPFILPSNQLINAVLGIFALFSCGFYSMQIRVAALSAEPTILILNVLLSMVTAELEMLKFLT